jgi:uncharacterized protein
MERITKIITDTKFKKHLKKIKKLEKKRKFCKHNMLHLLDVARIAYILNLENDLNINKELIYATALLHDIGKWKQYKHSIPHEKASAKLCVPILKRNYFDEDEIESIRIAILNHRNSNIKNSKTLSGIIYTADKLSRKCYICKVNKDCSWSKSKKNNLIIY